jgi:hypothetical protein
MWPSWYPSNICVLGDGTVPLDTFPLRAFCNSKGFFLSCWKAHFSSWADLLTVLLCVKRLTGLSTALLSVRELPATSLSDLPRRRPMNGARNTLWLLTITSNPKRLTFHKWHLQTHIESLMSLWSTNLNKDSQFELKCVFRRYQSKHGSHAACSTYHSRVLHRKILTQTWELSSVSVTLLYFI